MQPRFPVWLLSCLGVVLTLALVVASVSYQSPNSALCRGLLGAGFPLPFICDASGESPLSSVGRIDWADLDSINSFGSLVDFLFYGLILWGSVMLWQRASGILRRPRGEGH